MAVGSIPIVRPMKNDKKQKTSPQGDIFCFLISRSEVGSNPVGSFVFLRACDQLKNVAEAERGLTIVRPMKNDKHISTHSPFVKGGIKGGFIEPKNPLLALRKK